jgi:hypothetical protein
MSGSLKLELLLSFVCRLDSPVSATNQAESLLTAATGQQCAQTLQRTLELLPLPLQMLLGCL